MSESEPMLKLAPLDEGLGPALPLSEDRALALIERAMAAHSMAVPRSVKPRRRFAIWLAAAAATLLLVLVAFAAWQSSQGRPQPATTTLPPVEPSPEPPATSVELQPPLAEPPSAAPVAPDPAPPAPTSSARAATTHVATEDLLRRANALRGERRWLEAARTYERVVAMSPRSQEAYAARTAAAALYLEHLGDPRRALTLYQAAMAQQPHGALAEEARWGLVESYRALGDSVAEEAALRAFLKEHPQSLLRSRADERLEQLTRRP